jgi:predicted unusual protein kinase regulating ubiquinone biosynthesis (AarF/ABC1/UbiB family)
MQRQSVPTQIHDIQLRELVGQGAMGQVYLDERQGQQVAVKIQYPNISRTIRADFANMAAFLIII